MSDFSIFFFLGPGRPWVEPAESTGMSMWSLGGKLYGPNLVPVRFSKNGQSRFQSV